MKISSIVTALAAFSCAQGASIGNHGQIEKRATLTQVTNFGTNPTGVKMFIYVPQKLAAKPPVLLVLHACAWTAQKFFGTTKYAQFADQKGFVLIYGQTPTDGACWDVSSKATLTHDGGGDSLGVANMVRYALQKYSADATQMFVTGESSGAMMTQVMAAVYPDLFAGASEFSGEPAGCFSGGSIRAWNSQCAGGQIHKTAAQWASEVKEMYPGFTGTYPKMQIHHGDADTTLNVASYNESIKQWSGVFGYTGTATQAQNNNPGPKLTRYIYGERLQGIWGHGIGHVVPTNETDTLQFFGLI